VVLVLVVVLLLVVARTRVGLLVGRGGGCCGLDREWAVLTAVVLLKDVDRPLLAYRRLADPALYGLQGPTLALPVVHDQGWAKFQDWDLCTSHCGGP
jgi:hypothetical protein